MKKTKNSFIVAMLIISLFIPSIAIGNNINNNFFDVSKKIWDGSNWVESIYANKGDLVLFNITISYNNTDHPNASYLKKIKVTDYLPDGLVFNSGSPQPNEISGNILIWNYTDNMAIWLLDGQSMYIEFYARVFDTGVKINTVEAIGREFCSGIWFYDSDQASINECITNPGINLTKKVYVNGSWENNADVYVGNNVTFKIIVENTGDIDLTNVLIVDDLPGFLTYNYDSNPIHTTATDHHIEWNIGTLPIGVTTEITYTAHADMQGCGCNIAIVTTNEGVTDDDDACILSEIILIPEIEINKQVWDETYWTENKTVEIGNNVTFKIIVENTGDIDLTNVLIVDDLPGFLTYNYDSNPIHTTATDHHIEWNIGTLPIGVTTEITYTAHADMQGCGCNIAIVTTNEGVTDDDDACILSEIILIPEIEINKQVWDETYWTENKTVEIGENVTFKIIIENTGNMNLTYISISDYLPNFLKYNNDANITPDIIVDNQINWFINRLNISEQIEIIFSAVTLYLDSGCNIVEVFTKEGVEDEDEACITVTGMNVTKEIWNQETQLWVDEINASVGDTLLFKITIKYIGESIYSLSQIKVKDVLPECLEYANNANPPETNISSNGKKIWWNLSDILQSGDTINITFYTTITETSGCGPCINWVNVTAKKCSGVIFYGNDSAIVNADCPLMADIGGPYFGRQREMITITGSALGGTPPYILTWDLDDDGIYDDGTGESIKKSWSSPGTYIISLKVQDSKGRIDSEDTSVTISEDNNPPTNPLKPSGPDYGENGESYEFYTSSLDPNDDNIRYGWDWNGDGTIDEWTNYYESGTVIKTSHSWSSAGTYFIMVKAEDIHGALSQFSTYKRIVIHGNSAPNKPFISGSSSGKIDTSYVYSSITIDINGDQIYYFFDWGDGTNSGWIGPLDSGTPISESHIWNSTGSFTVKVKAKDTNNLESVWSDPISVSMPYAYNPLQQLFVRLINKYPLLEPLLSRFL